MLVSSQYPKDEFDRAGEDMPIGMHRAQPSKWKAVWPFLALLVIVPLAGWGLSYILTSRGVVTPTTVASVASSVTSTASASESPSPSATATTETPTPSPTASETPSASPSPTIPVRHSAKVSVLNGTGVQGLAAQKVSKLAAEGFDGATAANARGWDTKVSTVYYSDPLLESTAKEIARILEIDKVGQTDTGDPDIVVLLR